MSYKIGPRELFVPNACERNLITEQDNESAVTWYKENFLDSSVKRQRVIDMLLTMTCKKTNKNASVDGDYPNENFLLFCTRAKNTTLLKFIVEHIDAKSTLNLLDPTWFQTALGYAVMIKQKKTITPNSEYQNVCDKSYTCTKILLDGGANPNTFFSFTGLMEGEHSKQELIPSVAASVLIDWTAMIEENKKDPVDENHKQNCLTYTRHLEKMFLLFFQHRASIKLCDNDILYAAETDKKGLECVRQIDEHSVVEESDSPYIKEIVPKCVALIKHTQINANWEKYKLIFLAAKSPTSPFYSIPTEVNFLIGNCCVDLLTPETKTSAT